MNNLIKAEYIKGRCSFGRLSLWVFPLLVVLMATVMMDDLHTQIGALNWWYVLLLPMVLAIVCISLTGPEKRQNFFNVSVLPIPKTRIWVAKVLTGCSYLLLTNLLVFGISTILCLFFGEEYLMWRGITAAFVLTVTMAWQIPLGLFTSIRFSSPFTFIGILCLNIIFSTQTIAGGSFWFIPFAIQARLMAPILGINPNNLLLEAGSPLWDTRVILPGILIAAILFVITLLATRKWFGNRSE